MKTKLLLLFMSVSFAFWVKAQVPNVYGYENTGSACTKVIMPDASSLTTNNPLLPDPFAWFGKSGRSTDFADWECRRNEIKSSIEAYEIGPKQARPDTIQATYTNDTLRVFITKKGKTLTLTSRVYHSSCTGTGPFPVVIGMSSRTGSLDTTFFAGAIQIPFNHDQVVTYTSSSTKTASDPFYKLYPDLFYVGNYSAWSWGISRLIDGLSLVKAQLNADTTHIAVTGCSYAGKMALFGGAFDERIRLTIAQESGGGGTTSWRVAETLGNVEKIDNTNYSWFMPTMKTNFGGKVGYLPHDHHELMAMVAPRALLVLGNPDYEWLGDPAGYVDDRATEVVYNTLGVSDRFGFTIRGGHSHCALPTASIPEIRAFVQKFLFDKDTTTNIRVNPYPKYNYERWIYPWNEAVNANRPTIALAANGLTNDTVYSTTPVTLNATVTTPNSSVKYVAFFTNLGDSIGSATQAPYSITLSNLSPGTYSCYATVVSNDEAIGYAANIKFYVINPPAVAYKTNTPPTIDGTIDDVWNGANVMLLKAQNLLTSDSTSISPSNLSGYCKVLWDDTNIYLLGVVNDDVLMHNSSSRYLDDSVEFYFDADNSKGSSYDDNDVQYTFAWNDTGIGLSGCSGTWTQVNGNWQYTACNTKVSSTGINFKILNTSKGYIYEGAIPWTSIGMSGTPASNTKIGFDFMINDADSTKTRVHKLSWNATSDNAYQQPSLFGNLTLVNNLSTAVNEINSNDNILVFPNPTNNILYIKGLSQESEYIVIDISGKKVLAGKCQYSIAVDELPKGLYLLNIKKDNESVKLKFNKN